MSDPDAVPSAAPDLPPPVGDGPEQGTAPTASADARPGAEPTTTASEPDSAAAQAAVAEAMAAPVEPAHVHDEDETAPAPEADAEDEAPEAPATPAPTGSVRVRLRAAARKAALARFSAPLGPDGLAQAESIVAALESGRHLLYLARFRRDLVGGIDERRLAAARRAWREILAEEERRAELRELLTSRGALDETAAAALDAADSVAEMEDVAAPWLPVTASRATVARGQGLQPLADAIRSTAPGGDPVALSDLAKPHVREGTEVDSLDAALAGARDILAEAFCLDVELRRRLRALFRRHAVISVALRPDRKADVGRHAALLDTSGPAHRVPPMRLLALRRAERERVLSVQIEPPEADALEVVAAAQRRVFGDDHPHAGILRAATEDGYRRILRPVLAKEARDALKARADDAMSETYERALRNLLLGPVGGPRRTLGLRPDVTGGHRVAAIDESGRVVHAGRLPHEATAGVDAAVDAVKELLVAHAVDVVAVGSGAGRKEARALAASAVAALGRDVVVTEVPDGGTRAIETAAVERPVRTETGVEIGPEFVGAVSLARRFQDPLAEYVRLDLRSLGLGPHVHDVHQGRLKERLDDVTTWCVAHVGPDASTAGEAVLAQVPGLDAAKGKAFVAWRDAGGRLLGKAGLAGVVGIEAAEQAVGFLRVFGTGDPRDHTQLHPEQYRLVDAMAEQVGVDVATFFRDARARARVDLGALATEALPVPAWRAVLWQVAFNLADPRPRFAVPMKPPAELSLAALRPGLVLEGRVTRALPFGVLVDVGLPADAIVPLPHLGDHPGVDPAVVAPVGAVVQGRVLEIDLARKRITLSMRSDARLMDRAPRADRRGDRPARPDRGAARPDGGASGSTPGGAPATDRPPRADTRTPSRPDRFGSRAPGERRPDGGRPDRRGGERPAAVSRDRRSGAPAGAGFGSSGGRGGRDEGRRFDRDDPGTPRRISLPAEPVADPAPIDETALSPEELLAKKLEEMKRKLMRSG